MNAPVTKPPERASFLHLPVVSNWHGLDADAIIFGAAFGKPYRQTDFPNDQSSAPAALRAASDHVLVHNPALDIDVTPPVCLSNLRVVDGGVLSVSGDARLAKFADHSHRIGTGRAAAIQNLVIFRHHNAFWFACAYQFI